ncbi:MAG: replication-associated recombination protein A [Actinomycetota bacterium]|nr:replication-associated recombination protein A [Actinomycetota bacterium]
MPTPGAEDLFGAALQERLARQAPLPARLRPQALDDMVGQEDLLGPGRPLRTLIEADRLSSVILWGPPGTGKTTLARLIAGVTAKSFETLSAVTAGVKDVREAVDRARRRLGERGQGTILFIDEVHRFNRSQQDALLPSVEEGVLVLIGATTENPYFEVNAPLLSRSSLFRLEPLSAPAVRTLLQRGLTAEEATADDDALDHLVDRADGDARVALNALEVAIALSGEGRRVALAHAEAALNARALRYERDEHYDVISAFIKSVRGSDPDAGLYWLARMLEAGEDARYIARRLVVLASEDVGLADPLSLVVADAAARAVEFVGLPEAELNLAQAVVHLATAPKSNRVYAALRRAQADVRDRPAGAVPVHLRDRSYRGARTLGHGAGYDYPHDDPRGWVPQEYRPPEVAGRVYYEPSDHGREREIGERMRSVTGDQGPSGPGPSGPLSGTKGPSGPLSGTKGPSGPLSGTKGPSGPLSGQPEQP